MPEFACYLCPLGRKLRDGLEKGSWHPNIAKLPLTLWAFGHNGQKAAETAVQKVLEDLSFIEDGDETVTAFFVAAFERRPGEVTRDPEYRAGCQLEPEWDGVVTVKPPIQKAA